MTMTNTDLLDEGLVAVMGKERCRDVTAGKEPSPSELRSATSPNGRGKDAAENGGTGNPSPTRSGKQAPEAQWEPVKEEGFYDRLKAAVVAVSRPAALSSFFLWCQMTERMDSTTAVCAMFFCVAMAAFHVGRFFHAEC